MNAAGFSAIEMLLRTTLALSATAILVALVLRTVRPVSITVQRLAWLVVLAQGCLVARLPLQAPWYEAAPAVGPAIGAEELYARGDQGSSGPFDPEAMSSGAAHWSPGNSAIPFLDPRIWNMTVACVWLGGLAVAVSISIWRYAAFVRGLTPVAEVPSQWREEWDRLLAREGVSRRIGLRVTQNMGPFLCWLPSGYEVFVPAAAWRDFSSEQRLAILRHELAHFQRADLWKSLAARLLASAQWFNPLAWWAVARFDECAEWACDQVATRSSLAAAAEYSKALLALGSSPTSTPFHASAVRHGPAFVRIHRLLSHTTSKDSAMKKLVLILLPAVLLIAHFVRLELVAKEPAPNPATQSPLRSPDGAPPPAAAAIQKTDGKQDADTGKGWSELSKKEAAEIARRHIHGLVRAAHVYHEKHGSFPPPVVPNPKVPGGKRLSGFVLLLPYLKVDSWIDQGKPCFDEETLKLADELYESIDQTKAWDDPANLKAAKTIFPPLLAPQSGDFRDKQGYAVSHFAFVRGSMNGADGAFAGEVGLKMSDILDGTSGTLAIGQIINDLGPWLAEGLSTSRQLYDPTDQGPGTFGSKYKSGAFFALCDSSQRFFDLNKKNLAILQMMATRSGGELIRLDENVFNPFENE